MSPLHKSILSYTQVTQEPLNITKGNSEVRANQGENILVLRLALGDRGVSIHHLTNTHGKYFFYEWSVLIFKDIAIQFRYQLSVWDSSRMANNVNANHAELDGNNAEARKFMWKNLC